MFKIETLCFRGFLVIRAVDLVMLGCARDEIHLI